MTPVETSLSRSIKNIPSASKRVKTGVTVADAIDIYLCDRGQRMTPGSLQTIRARLDACLAFFRDMNINDITHDVMEDYVSHRVSQGYVRRSAETELSHLQTAIRSLNKKATNQTNNIGRYLAGCNVVAANSGPTTRPRVLITPALAATFLKGNTSNRPVTQSRVDAYARDMRDGQWVYNGNPIQICSDGRLINGQHRLKAVLKSQISVVMDIVDGLPWDGVFNTVDELKVRGAADHIATDYKDENPTAVAAALAVLNIYYNGQAAVGIGFHGGTDRRLVPELRALHPDIVLSVKACAGIGAGKKGLMIPRFAAVTHYLFACIDREAADDFFKCLRTGKNLYATDPVFTLREAFMDNRRNTLRFDGWLEMALAIKAWNFRRTDNWSSEEAVARKLRFRVGGGVAGTAQEDFPKPI